MAKLLDRRNCRSECSVVLSLQRLLSTAVGSGLLLVEFYRHDMPGEVPMHWLRIIAFAILACLVLIAAVGFIYEQIGRARQAFVVRADRSALLCPWPQHESVLLGLGFTDRRLRNRRERPRLFLAGSAAQSGPVHTRLLVRPRRSRLERFSRHSSHQREHRG